MRGLLLCFLISTAVGAAPAHCWNAVNHQLIAEIAKQSMEKDDVQKVEAILAQWHKFWPTFTSLQSSAFWMDFIKCTEMSMFCSGVSNLDGISLFSPYHYNRIPFSDDEDLKLPKHNSKDFTMLSHVWASLVQMNSGSSSEFIPGDDSSTTTGGSSFSIDYSSRNSGSSKGTSISSSSRSISSSSDNSSSLSPDAESHCKYGVCMNGAWKRHPGTIFAANLHLRILLHIYADMHQPMHEVNWYSKELPNGDGGGNLINLLLKGGRKVCLHKLWDESGCPTFMIDRKAPEKLVETIAAGYLLAYPSSKLCELRAFSAWNFQALAEESFQLAVQDGYKRLFQEGKFENGHWITPESYIQNVSAVGRRRVIVAGLRLAELLTIIAKNLPDPAAKQQSERGTKRNVK